MSTISGYNNITANEANNIYINCYSSIKIITSYV